jgi:leucyl aminopeptidase
VAADGATLYVGLGPAAELTAERVRHAATSAGDLLSGEVEVDFGGTGLVPALVDGLVTGYPGTGPVTLRVPPSLVPAAERGLLAADVARLARLLVSAPPNVLTPRTMAGWAVRVADRAGLGCTVLNPGQLAAQGFGALAAMGAGSANGPHLVQLSYPGAEPGAPTRTGPSPPPSSSASSSHGTCRGCTAT